MLSPDFVTQIVAGGEAHPDAGSVCGKLLRWDTSALKGRGFQPCRQAPQTVPLGAEVESSQRLKPGPWPAPSGTPEGVPLQNAPKGVPVQDHPEGVPLQCQTQTIDSTGIYFTRNMRHLDRGAEEIDRGQYDRPQYVFGASGAAVLFRRDFIQDVSVEGRILRRGLLRLSGRWRPGLARASDGLEVPVHAGSGGVACAAGHARAPQRPAAGHQLAFGEEPVSHARQERFRMAVLAVIPAGGVARYDDVRLRRCCAISECFRHWRTRGACGKAFAASVRSFSRAAAFPTAICYGGSAILRVRWTRRRRSLPGGCPWPADRSRH